MAVRADDYHTAPEHPPVLETTPEQARLIFDQQAQLYLGISGDEFLRRWNSGEYAADPDQPEVMELVMLLPLVQAQPVTRASQT